MGPIGCPETSITNYPSPLPNTPDLKFIEIHHLCILGLTMAEKVPKPVVESSDYYNEYKNVSIKA
jgi:hypothetical protein